MRMPQSHLGGRRKESWDTEGGRDLGGKGNGENLVGLLIYYGFNLVGWFLGGKGNGENDQLLGAGGELKP